VRAHAHRRSADIGTIFSTDYPYQYRPGGAGLSFLNGAALSPAEKELFAYGNWERLTQSVSR
jgi:hypothetical protein